MDINWNYATDNAQSAGGGDAFSAQFGGIVGGSPQKSAPSTDAFTAAYGNVVKQAPANPAKQPANIAATPTQAKPKQGTSGTIGDTVLGALKGITAPIEGGSQALAHGVAAVAEKIAPDSAVTHWIQQQANQQDADIAARAQDYSQKVGDSNAAQIAQFGGSIVGPGGAGGKFLSAAKSVPGLIARGATVGAASSAAQPVVIQQAGQPAQPDSVPADQYAQAKAYQAATGALGGGIAAPVAAQVGKIVAPVINKAATTVKNAVTPAATATQTINNQVEVAMQQVAKEFENAGQKFSDVPPAMRDNLKKQVQDAIKSGNVVDPVQLQRAADFEALGIQPTVAQITRDPSQFTVEKNLRGIAGAGEPLAARYNEQNAQLTNLLQDAGARTAPEADVAGASLMNRLKSIDQPTNENIGKLYEAARDSSGRAALMDTPAFAKAANDALDESMLGSALPAGARDLMNNISTGKVPFNVNNAVQADRVFSGMQRDATAAGNNSGALAIGKIRDALNSTPIASTSGKETKAAFDTARAAAKERFDTIASTPALKGALDDVSPDQFVRKYVINADTRDAQKLADYIKNDPDAQQIVRGQIANYLKTKALGANAAGDTQFAQASYNKALSDLKTNKLLAFFTPDEVNRLQAAGRVAAYINTQPSGSAVNNSNTGAAMMNLFSTLGNSAKSGFSSLPIVESLIKAKSTFQTQQAVSNALKGKVESKPASAERINKLLGPAAIGTGAIIGSD